MSCGSPHVTPPSPAASRDADVTTRAAGYGLFMLTVVYAFNFVDRQILVILQEPIKNEMGLSDGQLGLLSGFSFALVYITAGIPIAYWADRTNRRNIIAVALAVWSGMTALSGLAQNYSQLLLARIGVGIGEAGGSPPAHSMISDYFPPQQRTQFVANQSIQETSRLLSINQVHVNGAGIAKSLLYCFFCNLVKGNTPNRYFGFI